MYFAWMHLLTKWASVTLSSSSILHKHDSKSLWDVSFDSLQAKTFWCGEALCNLDPFQDRLTYFCKKSPTDSRKATQRRSVKEMLKLQIWLIYFGQKVYSHRSSVNFQVIYHRLIKDSFYQAFQKCHSQMFIQIAIFKTFAKFTGKQFSGLQLYYKENPAQMVFFCEFCKIYKYSLFT